MIFDYNDDKATFYADIEVVKDDVKELALGENYHFTFEVGRFDNNENVQFIYADYTLHVDENFMISIYIDDNDKGYIGDKENGIFVELPYDVFAKCEEAIYEKGVEIQVEIQVNKLYEVYKKEWLKDHVAERDWNEVEAEWENQESQESYGSFEEFYEEVGFAGGQIYACREEFIDSEYQDIDWLASHLDARTAAFLVEHDDLSYFPVPYGSREISSVVWKDDNCIAYDQSRNIKIVPAERDTPCRERTMSEEVTSGETEEPEIGDG